MASLRTIDTLTEAWPDDPANFELQAFAASLADDLPALSPPALNRIEEEIACELDRRQQPAIGQPSRPMRIARSVARRAVPAARMLAPYAAAACLLVGVGVWLDSQSATPVTPQQPGGTLITDQPPQWQAPTPEEQANIPEPTPTKG